MNTLRKSIKSVDSFLSSYIFGTSIGAYPVLKGAMGRRRLKKTRSTIAHELYNNYIVHFDEANPVAIQLANHAAKLLDNLQDGKIPSDNLQVIHQKHSLKVSDYHHYNREFGKQIDEFYQWITDALGLPITIISTLVWRNYHTSKPSLFSGDWHFDRRPTNWYRVFIIASEEVNHACGPFTYLDRNDSIRVIRRGFNRDADNVGEYEYVESNKFLGKQGDIVIVDTQYLLHRAGNPEIGKTRDMIEIVFKI